MESINLPYLVQKFFEERLVRQKGLSKHTLASYSCSFQLLFKYAHEQLKKQPTELTLQDCNAQFVNIFLNYLETHRNIKPQSRNVYLNAIRSFFQYLSLLLPEQGRLINEVLGIHKKKVTQKLVTFLNSEEYEALLAAINQKTNLGRRDHTLLLLAIDSGLRLSELINLKWSDVSWTIGSIHCVGKGRKEREVRLSKQVFERLQLWRDENKNETADKFIFSTKNGIMSPDTFQYLVKKYARIAAKSCPSISGKTVTPHVLRHTAIMRVLQSGVDLAKVALWVGHESIKTTYGYLSVDSKMKEEILNKLQPVNSKTRRYKPDNDIIAFLKRFDRSNTGKKKT